DPFLQRRQGVDVLDVRRSTRDCRGNLPDLRCGELYQRQHLRGDRVAIRWNAIRGYPYFGAPAVSSLPNRLSQCGQRGLREQSADISVQSLLTHPLHQLHRQERVSADLKEMILSPHSLDLQHL